ncbi:MAG: nucleotidyltransferase family protein [Tepidiformaceae bacterium]
MISSILLGAGISQRMGKPKPLLDWGGEPLIAYQVRQLREAGLDEVIVVLGFHGDEIHRQIRNLDCRVMFNARYPAGRSGSLRIGAKAVNRDTDAIVVLNVDQPRPASFTRSLIDAHQPSSVATRPLADGRHGHPVIISGRLREELMAATEEEHGLQGILRRHASELADYPADAICHLDVNTPEEYRAALERFEFAR